MLCTIWEEISAKGGSAGRAKRSARNRPLIRSPSPPKTGANGAGIGNGRFLGILRYLGASVD
jgi:hypothetical protein